MVPLVKFGHDDVTALDQPDAGRRIHAKSPEQFGDPRTRGVDDRPGDDRAAVRQRRVP